MTRFGEPNDDWPSLLGRTNICLETTTFQGDNGPSRIAMTRRDGPFQHDLLPILVGAGRRVVEPRLKRR